MIYYCDSSAVVKIYLEEAGTAFMRDLRRNASIGDIIINVIGGPEVMAQLIEKYPLRGYDSVQLATAVAFQNFLRASNGREVAFVGADKVLNDAARKEGLTVINLNEQL